jgi:hypothetical protein
LVYYRKIIYERANFFTSPRVVFCYQGKSLNNLLSL